MIQSKPLFTKAIMGTLTVALSAGAVLANGSVLAIIARFKSLRTVPNLLIANLSAVDLLNAAINMPINMIFFVLKASWYRGQTLAIMTSFFNRLFVILNLASMMALMASVYFGFAFDLRFFAWKTNKKAVVFACLIWFFCTMLTILYSIPLLNIDLGDAPVTEYRAEIFKQGKHFAAVFMAFFVICAAMLGLLTTCSIRKMKKKRTEMNLPALQAQARLLSDIKATKTIAITVGAYFFCYVPGILYAALGQQDRSRIDSWFVFLSWYGVFFSSAVNPIIYYLRTNRFRSAFKQFVKDPFGSSDYKDKPNGRVKGRVKPKPERAAAEGGTGGDNKSESVHVDGNQARPQYHDEDRNEVHLCDLEAGERCDGGTPEQQRGEALDSNSATLSGAVSTGSFPPPRVVEECTEACASTPEVQWPWDDTDEEIEEESVEVLEKSVMEDDSRNRKLPCTMKIHPIGTSECRAQEEREVLTHSIEEMKRNANTTKRRNAITPFYLPHQDRSKEIENRAEVAEETVVIEKFHQMEEIRG